MNKKNYYFTIICFFLSLSSFAQRELLQGKITNKTDIDGIHVLNISSRYSTITNEMGSFSIKVNRLDTLLFSSIKYTPEKIVVTDSIFEKGTVTIQLQDLVNELDEVYLAPELSGNIAADIKKIKIKETINFDDVGIPGFKGTPEEKIVPVYLIVTPTTIDVEALYKYISGYYKELKMHRKWEGENTAVVKMIKYYTIPFFESTYNIPENRVYDFLLFCAETSEVENDFKTQKYGSVLLIFEKKGKEYASRLKEGNEQ